MRAIGLLCVVYALSTGCIFQSENKGGDDDDDDANCTNPDFPVFCGEFDNDCWAPGTDCSFPVHNCGGSRWRCTNGDDWAACCDDLDTGDETFYTCTSTLPHACPDDLTCYADPNPSCDLSVCTFTAVACS